MQISISNEEWKIMQVLWEAEGAVTSSGIVASMGGGRSPKTLKTYLQRLVSKGFVDFTVSDEDSRVYLYSPTISEDECIRKENKDFVSLYYKGNVSGMLARFIGDSKLTEEQIEELSALLNAKKDESL